MKAKDIQQKIKDLYANADPNWQTVSDTKLLLNELVSITQKERYANMSLEEKQELSKTFSKAQKKACKGRYPDHMMTPEAREKAVAKQRGSTRPQTVKAWKKIRNRGYVHPTKGKKRPAKTIKKMTRLYIGTNVETGEEIIAEGTQGVKDLGFSQSMVSECCNGKRETCKGYRWRKEVREVTQ